MSAATAPPVEEFTMPSVDGSTASEKDATPKQGIFAAIAAGVERMAGAIGRGLKRLWAWIKDKARWGWAKITGAARWCQAKAKTVWSWTKTKASATWTWARTNVPAYGRRAWDWTKGAGTWCWAKIQTGWYWLRTRSLFTRIGIAAGAGSTAGGVVASSTAFIVAGLVLVGVLITLSAFRTKSSPVVKLAEQNNDGSLTAEQQDALDKRSTEINQMWDTASDAGDRSMGSEAAGRAWVLDGVTEHNDPYPSATKAWEAFRLNRLGELDDKQFKAKYDAAAVRRGISAELKEMRAILDPAPVS